MVKVHTTVSIDHELVEKAKSSGMNISALTEKAIREKAGTMASSLPIEEGEKCDFCGRKEEKQTAEDLTKGLCWLFPDELWICDNCLKGKVKRVSVAMATK